MPAPRKPLAVRMRPTSVDEILGQDHILQPTSPLHRMMSTGNPTSSIFLWGPPASAKTTIAYVIAETTSALFTELSAVNASVKEVRTAIDAAKTQLTEHDQPTVLFIDEIHRFSKAQQDALLPAVENGWVTLVAATTENPSFSVNNALLSRSMLLTLKPLQDHHIAELVTRAISDPRGYHDEVSADESTIEHIARLAQGDARRALTYLEQVAESVLARDETQISIDDIDLVIDKAVARYDRDGDQHYDVISAFIKSMRGSDPDAALHWMAVMIDAGEDPRFIARRIIVHASEDVGMADPTALQSAIAAAHAVQLLGLPEARINLAQAVIHIATAPKSNQTIQAIDSALSAVRNKGAGEVPIHLRDSHYKTAKTHYGHGVGYKFPHQWPYGVVAQNYLPAEHADAHHYIPTTHGFEKDVTKRLETIRSLQQKPEHQ